MGTAAPTRIHQTLANRMLHARKRSDELFALVREEAIYDRPIPERHRIIFYLGQLEAFIEHRLMHAETLTYMLHRLPTERKIAGPKHEQEKPRQATPQIVDIPAGTATLGTQKTQNGEFGWDNEFGLVEKHVPEFAIESLNVTNRDFLRFVEAGGYQEKTFWSDEARQWIEQHDVEHPAFWSRTGSSWMYRTMFGEVPLPADWPVYVSHAEASAYAKWMGRRLPTEEQFHRAAYGTPERGTERRYPWGDEAPTSRHGNFDF